MPFVFSVFTVNPIPGFSVLNVQTSAGGLVPYIFKIFSDFNLQTSAGGPFFKVSLTSQVVEYPPATALRFA